MNDWADRLLAIANRAVKKAQDENRRKGIPNVYVVNGTIVWQLPDGTITTTDPFANAPVPPSADPATSSP